MNQRVSIKNVEVKLNNELSKYERKFEFPPNPAFHLKSQKNIVKINSL